MAPNFYMPDYGSRMTSSVYVRGLGARMDQPVVGLNIDNVPVLNKDAYDFDVFDIERIEVLRVRPVALERAQHDGRSDQCLYTFAMDDTGREI